MSKEQPASSDLDLVRRIKAGDEQAFQQMVERYHARVYSLSYGVLRNAEGAEEAAGHFLDAPETSARPERTISPCRPSRV